MKGGNLGFLAWIVVGLIAGWLAGQVMKGGGYGVVVDIILGILGGLLGGWVFAQLGIWPGGGMIGIDHRRIYRRGDSGWNYPLAEERFTDNLCEDCRKIVRNE